MTYVHRYIHTPIHTHMHTCIHTCMIHYITLHHITFHYITYIHVMSVAHNAYLHVEFWCSIKSVCACSEYVGAVNSVWNLQEPRTWARGTVGPRLWPRREGDYVDSTYGVGNQVAQDWCARDGAQQRKSSLSNSMCHTLHSIKYEGWWVKLGA